MQVVSRGTLLGGFAIMPDTLNGVVETAIVPRETFTVGKIRPRSIFVEN
jgi:hypothetical protein